MTTPKLPRRVGRPGVLRRFHISIRLALGLAWVGLGLFWFGVPAASAQAPALLELGANFSYIRANAPPGACGCFAMVGGSGWLGYNFRSRWTLVGEVNTAHASAIGGNPAGLTLTSFVLGPRYAWHRGRIVPFGQILGGGSHSSGAVTGGTAGLTGSKNAVAMTLGGGVDWELNSRLTWRAVQVDYYLTGYENGARNSQNSLRLGTGIVINLFRHRSGPVAPVNW